MYESNKMTIDELNGISMSMIMKAGNCHDIITKAINNIEKLASNEMNERLEEAKKEIVNAHQFQTKVIQSTLEDETFKPNLLFTHAQDTVMTIYSEYHNAKHLNHIYQLLKK